jgi:hypothetical protein
VKNTLFLPLILLGLNLSAQDTPTVAPQITTDSLNKSIGALKKDIDLIKNLKITGWVQAQYQMADTAGAKNFDGGDFPTNSSNRFMIRRGRVKFTYNGKNSQYVMQINGTERGVNLVEIFAKATDPWMHALSITAGVMNRPFGYEIQQSSADRESPERSRWTQIFLPNERDLGAMLTFQPAKGKKLYGLKIDAGLYNGEGIAVPGTSPVSGATATPVGLTGVNGLTDFDSYKDLIAHIAYYSSTKNGKIKYGIGASHYNGGFAYQNNKVYNSIKTDTLGNKVWTIADTISKNYRGGYAPRVYTGFEGLFSINTPIGTTTIRGEYFFGTQTSKSSDSKSPQSTPGATDAMFVRNFNAGYAYFIHRIGKSKHEVVFKYEWLDPNTKIAAADLNGKNGMNLGELKYTMMGFGYNLYLYENVKFMLHYNLVKNEIGQIKGYTYDLKDNILTIRMQYRF